MAVSSETEKTIPQMEEFIAEYWAKNKIFEKSIEQRSENNIYIFYDGPPFISGLPHYGHLLGSIAKDVIPRFQTMKGKRVERVWGWDAHGLTVENKVQKKFGIKNRRDIEKFGLEKFAEECANYTKEVSEEWEWYVNKIGRWVDFKNSYKTTDQSYMESVMWTFKQLYDKGLVYEGIRTSLYCTKCGTPVSNFEVAMDNSYKDVEDPAITVKFRINSESSLNGVYALAWTTTPWTIPSNRALVADENSIYVIIDCCGEKYLVAESRLENVFDKKDYQVIDKVVGKSLIGLKYEPPFRFYKSKPGEFEIYTYPDMVSADEGTGIVHSAPGFGEIDSEMGRHYGITLMQTIDDEGKFLAGTEETNPYAGVYYAEANPMLIQDLVSRNLLFKNEKVIHRFPYHDRCDTLLIQRAQDSWFINVSSLKPKMAELNENINWVPEHLKHGRFGQNILQQPDWCVSRNRYWATPMPVWESEDGDRLVVSSIEEIEKLSGQKIENLHRPYIDKIEIKKDGKTYKRRKEVLDSWLDAGSMPWAQVHYPFENVKKFEKNYPGDYIVEYIAQVRAWFNVMHILSTAVFGTNSFKNVISTGVMAGSDGRKMSKTFGNYTDPKEVLQNYGGDALRLYFMGSPLMLGENANFDESELRTKLRNVLNPLWNSVKFFKTYAVSNNWKYAKNFELENVLDRWVVARLHETLKTITEGYESYHLPVSARAAEDFVDDLSRWYVRRSRERLSSGDTTGLSVFYEVLMTFSKAVAPIIPFITESIFLELKDFGDFEEQSIHLCDFPDYDQKIISESGDLVKNMKIARDVVSFGLSLRSDNKVSVRQPLAKMILTGLPEMPKELLPLVLDELNIKKLEYSNSVSQDKNYACAVFGEITACVDLELTEDLIYEGKVREFIRKIQDLRKEMGLKVGDLIEAEYPKDQDYAKVLEKYGDSIRKKTQSVKFTPSQSFTVRKI